MIPNNDSESVKRTRQILNELDDDASFAFIAGDEYGTDCTLEAGDYEPTAVHMHLLATYLSALSDVLDEDADEIAREGLRTLQRMEDEGAIGVSEELGGDDLDI